MKKVAPQNTIYKKPFIITLLATYIAFASCGVKKNIPQEQPSMEKNSKIIFLNYTISKKPNSDTQIQFINKIIAKGKLKNHNISHSKHSEIGDLICIQLDEKLIPIQSTHISNPLYKTIEFVNDSLSFEKKTVTLNKSTIALRLQLRETAKYIALHEVIDSLQNSKELIKTKVE